MTTHKTRCAVIVVPTRLAQTALALPVHVMCYDDWPESEHGKQDAKAELNRGKLHLGGLRAADGDGVGFGEVVSKELGGDGCDNESSRDELKAELRQRKGIL